MTDNIMEYKGYHTKIEFIAESCTLRGKIEGIHDFIDFETDDVQKVEEEFHAAVDDYLEFCEEVGKEPEKEYKGSFNVRISPALHKKLVFYAWKDECSLNAEVEKAIRMFIENEQSPTRILAENVRELTETLRIDHSNYGNETKISCFRVIPFETKHTYGEEEVKAL